ncbi:MAG TPA: c-type cytochrome [Saprospiraceae bacterium]|nr:c-type cytochrome [Saprospiraceae bacterium]
MDQQQERVDGIARAIIQLKALLIFILAALILTPVGLFYGEGIYEAIQKELATKRQPVAIREELPKEIFWSAPDPAQIQDIQLKARIAYGKELVAHTAKYLGPKGMVMQISNGMNCQNCHLEAGTKTFGNNYSAVASTYPKFRARSGTSEDLYKRINDCFERSLNGQPLDSLSKEMQAIKAYINFLGSNVAKGDKPNGAGLKELAYMDREADPEKGKLVYQAKCVSCHQADGQGQMTADGTEYTYPPLWGKHSYNDGAGLYRISNFAKYIKYNMPQGVTHKNPLLSDEESWDLAAYVNSQNRPHINVPKDWPDIAKKPVDHPFGPYADSFSEKQHKFGPFKPILKEQNISPPTAQK